MSQDPCATEIGQMRREIALVCDQEGVVTWADQTALCMLERPVGRALADLAAPGAEQKVRDLLQAARARAVERWELALVAQGAPVTMSFHGRPVAEGVALVGNMVPEDFSLVLGQVNTTLGELAVLHRKTAAQQLELERRHEELLRLHRELTDSNRGVVALHAELGEKEDSLHRVAESRKRVVANVSHEFRTPVNSILGLAQLLLSEADGPLTAEQSKQIGYIRKSAEALSTLANDLLDLSKLEAGKLTLRATSFAVADLFGALRGVLKPLVPSDAVELVFEEPASLPRLETDESKVAQVLRNLITNALKFTERGAVRVRARAVKGAFVEFVVSDTGVGIAPHDHQRVFEEFTQIENPLQGRSKGTGLGLSLSRRLADLLGGELTLQSALGQGSTFTLRIPRVHPDVAEMSELARQSEQVDPTRAPVLVVEDDRQTLFLYGKYLEGAGYQIIPARTIDDARHALQRVQPAAIVLDVMLEGESSWRFLADLKSSERTRHIPTLVVTVTDREQKARALGADEFYVKPIDGPWLLAKLKALARTVPVERVLVIDDDDVARYLVRKLLEGLPYTVLEAADGAEGLRLAREEHPQVIFLDFVMPEMSAFEVLDELKKDPATRGIPVIINTSKQLAEEERARLASATAAILSKQSLSREVAIARIREALVKAGVQPAGRV